MNGSSRFRWLTRGSDGSIGRIWLSGIDDPIARSQLDPIWWLDSVVLQREMPREKFKASFVLVQVDFRERPEDVQEKIHRFRERFVGPIFVLDWEAGPQLRFGAVAALDDVYYVKKSLLRDKRRYDKDFLGGSNLTHRLIVEGGIEQSGVSPDIVPGGHYREGKILLGWNLALSNYARNLLKFAPLTALCSRRRPVHSSGLETLGWKRWYREPGLELLRSRGQGVECHQRGLWLYLGELCRAKLCFSPFGFGETCWRDLEAMALGAVVIKQDMSHLETSPDLYVPGETYIPFQWDYSNFLDVIDDSLRKPAECARIRRNAKEQLRNALAAYSSNPLIARLRVLVNAGLKVRTSRVAL